MKISRLFEKNTIKEGISNYVFELHFILLFGILCIALSVFLIPVGGALIALCSCTRRIADNESVNTHYFFRIFKEKFLLGIPLSFILIIVISSKLALSYIEINQIAFNKMALNISNTMIVIVLLLIFYYPFAAHGESKWFLALKKSIYYFSTHIWETIIQISFLYILWVIIITFAPIFLILFIPSASYSINRYIIGNNRELDKKLNKNGH